MRHFSIITDFLTIALFALAVSWIVMYPKQDPQQTTTPTIEQETYQFPEFREYSSPPPKLRPKPPAHVAGILDSVYQQREITQSYDPAYVKLRYPGGDVPLETGVCSDVVIRAFREQQVDLQREVHQDMKRAFRQYPREWGLRSPDPNIDHRRVLNLMTYFKRRGVDLPVSDDPDAYLPGDVVAWKLNEKQYHIGIVMKARSYDEQRPLIGHNINAGVVIQDVLFDWEIIGHYRYFDAAATPALQAAN